MTQIWTAIFEGKILTSGSDYAKVEASALTHIDMAVHIHFPCLIKRTYRKPIPEWGWGNLNFCWWLKSTDRVSMVRRLEELYKIEESSDISSISNYNFASYWLDKMEQAWVLYLKEEVLPVPIIINNESGRIDTQT